MSMMQSETYRAPLFQAHMLGHGQKRKHSNGSVGQTTSPSSSRTITKAIHVKRKSDLHLPSETKTSTTPAIKVEEEKQDKEERAYVRLGGGNDTDQPQEKYAVETVQDAGAKGRGSYANTLPFPARVGRFNPLEVLPNGEKPRKFPDPNNAPEMAAAIRPRKDPAPRLFGEALADCYPWKGHEVEDKLTEQVIKTGLTDRSLVSGETHSARTTVEPYLKQPATLQNLSTFLITAMEMRQEHSRVTANSTFKPPPRVTLTDTRREAWLRDLADEAIPLRRLSRTIPHGIRGRVLLDHCLDKSIPVKRAVWLAQCVGANEIRAFKRKGVSGAITTSNERKWVQEWTSTLEVFLDAILKDCEKAESKLRLIYALDLTQNLYSEQLLDRDHFLNWSLSMAENSTLRQIPLCFLIIRIVWKDFLTNFNFSSRLVLLLIKVLSMLTRLKQDAEAQQLRNHIQHFIVKTIKAQPLSALVSSKWRFYRPYISALLKDPIIGPVLTKSKILERNDRLASILSNFSCGDFNPKESGIKYLDDRISNAQNLVRVDNLVDRCLEMLDDVHDLVFVLIQWACSLFRVGHHRIYLVSRLLQDLARRGFDTSGSILHCLGELQATPGICAEAVTELLSELSRTRNFDNGRYLRWLIATGSLNGCSEQEFSARCDIRFLVEMPSTRLSSNVSSMRSMLLRRFSISPRDDSALAGSIISYIKHRTSDLDTDAQPRYTIEAARNLDIAGKEKVVNFILDHFTNDQTSVSTEVLLSQHERRKIFVRDNLCLVLEILDHLKHADAVARIVTFCVSSSDMDFIALLAEALFIHHNDLAALGVLPSLWLKLLGRYRQLRINASPDKNATLALERVIAILHPPNEVIDYFKQEIALAEQNTGTAVFTPASEGMMDAAENSASDSDEEIERMLGSATALDPTSMRRVFLLLVKRLMSDQDDSRPLKCSRLCALLSRLRILGPDEYSKLLVEYLREIETRLANQQKLRLFRILIGGDVCTFAEVSEHLQSKSDRNTGVHDFLELLLAQIDDEPSVEPTMRYHFILQRFIYLESHGIEIADYAFQAMTENDPADSDQQNGMQKLLRSNLSIGIFKRLLLANPVSFAEKLELYLKPGVEFRSNTFLGFLLEIMACQDDERVRKNSDAPVKSVGTVSVNALLTENFPLSLVFESVDEISLPFWKVMLKLRLKALPEGSKNLHEWKDEVVEAVKVVAKKKSPFWTQLLPDVGETAAREVFLFVTNIVVAPSKLREMISNSPQIRDRRLSCLEILKSAAFAVRTTSYPDLAHKILTALTSLYAHWKDQRPSMSNSDTDEDRKSFTGYLRVVLSLLLILHNTFRKSSHGSDLLQILCKFLATDLPLHDEAIGGLIFDVAAYFTTEVETHVLGSVYEGLPAPVRQHEAVQYLLGMSSAADSWLHIAQKLPSQQHALSSRPSNSEQIYSSTTPFPLRPWELLPDAAPAVGPNDTAISLRLFDAKKLS